MSITYLDLVRMLTDASVMISTFSLTLRCHFSLQKYVAPNSNNEENDLRALNFINMGMHTLLFQSIGSGAHVHDLVTHHHKRVCPRSCA